VKRLRKLLDWHSRVRYGYRAPATRARVRCSRGQSVLFGTIYSDNGSWIQVLVEGETLVALPSGAWNVEDAAERCSVTEGGGWRCSDRTGKPHGHFVSDDEVDP